MQKPTKAIPGEAMPRQTISPEQLLDAHGIHGCFAMEPVLVRMRTSSPVLFS
jgi:hypothetical protein